MFQRAFYALVISACLLSQSGFAADAGKPVEASHDYYIHHSMKLTAGDHLRDIQSERRKLEELKAEKRRRLLTKVCRSC